MDAGVKLIGYQMAVDLLGLGTATFICGIEYGGGAKLSEFAGESDICLFI